MVWSAHIPRCAGVSAAEPHHHCRSCHSSTSWSMGTPLKSTGSSSLRCACSCGVVRTTSSSSSKFCDPGVVHTLFQCDLLWVLWEWDGHRAVSYSLLWYALHNLFLIVSISGTGISTWERRHSVPPTRECRLYAAAHGSVRAPVA